MLRSEVISTYGQCAGYSTFALRDPSRVAHLRGRTIYTRHHMLAGYAFVVPNDSCFGSFTARGKGYGSAGIRNAIDVYLAFLNRLIVGCDRGNSEVRSLMGESSLQGGTFVLIQVSPFVLADTRFQDSLVRTANVIRTEGFRLKVAIDSVELEEVRDLRLFRQALYQLEDQGIGVVLKNPQAGRDSPFAESVVYRAVPQLAVSPQWLGIGEGESSFDHSLYLERVTLINSAIHEDGKSVICESITNDWQRSFVAALPVNLFGFPASAEDVII